MSIPDQIPELYIRRGDALAAGQRAQGQFVGSLVSNLAQAPQQIIQAQAQQKSDQLNQQIQQQRVQAGQIGIQKELSQIQGQEAVKKLMASGVMTTDENGVVTWDKPKFFKGLADIGQGDQIPHYEAIINSSNEAAAKMQKSRMEAQQFTADVIGASGAAVHAAGNDPNMFATEVHRLVANKVMPEADGQQALDAVAQDPSKVPALTGAMMAGSPKYKGYALDESTRKSQDAKRATDAQVETDRQATAAATAKSNADQRATANAAGQLAAATSQADYERRYKGLPAEIQAKFDAPETWNPKTSAQRARFVGMTPEKQQDALNDQRRLELEAQRERRLGAPDTGGSGGTKPPTAGERAAAERWKAGQLADLEDKFAAGQPNPDGSPKYGKDGQKVAPMSVEDLNKAKAQIQSSYLAQIGVPQAKGAPAQRPTSGKPGMPADGTTGMVGGRPAVWKSNGPKGPGWYAASTPGQ